MLATHVAMTRAIGGHTDDVGAVAANQSLSEQRAAAVRAYRVEHHQADATA